MEEWKKQGSALIWDELGNHHRYEIQETEKMRYALRIDGEVIHFFDNLEYAKRVASLIEEDAWN